MDELFFLFLSLGGAGLEEEGKGEVELKTEEAGDGGQIGVRVMLIRWRDVSEEQVARSLWRGFLSSNQLHQSSISDTQIHSHRFYSYGR